MGTSYVLCAACATARKPAKRALHQSFRDPLSRPPDSTVVIVNCGTSALQPLNMLRATTFCVRYQAGGRPMACRTGSRTRSDELFFRGWRHDQWPIQHRVRLGILNPATPE